MSETKLILCQVFLNLEALGYCAQVNVLCNGFGDILISDIIFSISLIRFEYNLSIVLSLTSVEYYFVYFADNFRV